MDSHYHRVPDLPNGRRSPPVVCQAAIAEDLIISGSAIPEALITVQLRRCKHAGEQPDCGSRNKDKGILGSSSRRNDWSSNSQCCNRGPACDGESTVTR